MKQMGVLCLLLIFRIGGIQALPTGQSTDFASVSADSTKRFLHGTDVFATYSYLGFSLHGGYSLSCKSSTLGLGIRTSSTYFTRYSDVPYGYYIDYKRNLFEGRRVESFAELFYGTLFFNVTSPAGNKALYKSKEIYAGYGMSYRAGAFRFSNTLGIGLYNESHPNFYGAKEPDKNHVGYFVKLGVAYGF